MQAAPKIRGKRKGKGPFEEIERVEDDGTCEVVRTSSYVAARLVDGHGVPARVDMVGVDIGKLHTGICGFDRTDLAHGWPRVTAIALLDAGGGRGRAAHYACDKLDELFARDPALAWVRESATVHVEQQPPQNPQAKQVAQGIRSALRCLRMAQGTSAQDVCVAFINGQSKYVVAPAVCPDIANADPMRMEGVKLTGHKNKPKRKKLGERDAHAVLTATAQSAAINMIARVCDGVDQIHDVTDALLIGIAGELRSAQESAKLNKQKKKTPK
jgi:hypothetical protein